MKREWMVFSHDGKELARYTLRGTFYGELEDTICLLAYENSIPEDEIKFEIVMA